MGLRSIVIAWCAASLLAMWTACAWATNNIISDQIVNGAGNPYQRPGGGNATLADLGLGTVPVGSNPAVRVVPWASIPDDIAQMESVGGKLYFGTTTGRIWEYNRFGQRNAVPYLDIPSLRSDFSADGPFSGQGLRGFAFHPDFASNGLLYTMHRETSSGGAATHGDLGANAQYVLSEWNFKDKIEGQPAFRSLLRVGYPATDHAGGQIGFNPAASPGDPDYGKLYAGFGDGGGAFSGSSTRLDMFGYGQNFSTIQSSVIRINPLKSGSSPYTIPSDNPFLSANDPGNAIPDEMFAKGFRNASTLMFDQATGKLFIGDISQNTIEEVNLIESGRNYGWGIQEGTWHYADLTNTSNSIRYVPLGDGSDVTATSATYSGKNANGDPVTFSDINRLNDGYTPPVAQFSHEANGGTSAVVTGTVYRGSLAPQLNGLFLFGNLSQDEVYYVHENELVNDETPAQVFELNLLDVTGAPTSLGDIVGSNRANIRFGQDDMGEIFIISKHNDMIYRLEAPLSTPSILGDLDIDGDVDADDLADFVAGWLSQFPAAGVESWRHGDLNLDRFTNLADVQLMHQALVDRGMSSPFSAAVPEPACSLLALMGAAFCGGRTGVGRRRLQTVDSAATFKNR